jgi:hypothetical protein
MVEAEALGGGLAKILLFEVALLKFVGLLGIFCRNGHLSNELRQV